MFDTYRISQSPSHVTVENKLAPTAEHLRLLAEMREQVRREVEASIAVNNTEFGSVTSYYSNEDRKHRLFCRINGKTYTATVDDIDHLRAWHREMLAQELVGLVAATLKPHTVVTP